MASQRPLSRNRPRHVYKVRLNLPFLKTTTKKPAAKATGFFILHGNVLVSQGETPNYIRR